MAILMRYSKRIKMIYENDCAICKHKMVRKLIQIWEISKIRIIEMRLPNMEKGNLFSAKKWLSEYWIYIYIFGRIHFKYEFFFRLKINTLYPISVYECKITGKTEVGNILTIDTKLKGVGHIGPGQGSGVAKIDSD